MVQLVGGKSEEKSRIKSIRQLSARWENNANRKDRLKRFAGESSRGKKKRQ